MELMGSRGRTYLYCTGLTMVSLGKKSKAGKGRNQGGMEEKQAEE